MSFELYVYTVFLCAFLAGFGVRRLVFDESKQFAFVEAGKYAIVATVILTLIHGCSLWFGGR